MSLNSIVSGFARKVPGLKKSVEFLMENGLIPPPPLPVPRVEGAFVGVWILGGLGNQLFQYAAGFALSKRIGATLLLDRNFAGYSREEALSKIGIEARAWDVDRPSMLYSKKTKGLPYRVIDEKNISFDPSVFNIAESCYLHGYWDSHKYFHDCAGDVRKTLDFNRCKTPDMDAELTKMAGTSSVSVHVRRGDYATKAGVESFGLIDRDFYDRAARLLLRINPNCHFYIFSDDPTEANRIFGSWPNAEIMPMRSACQDMLLMASCRHHIIANSTFSWWGAWLGTHPDGITIAPRHWFTKEATIAHKYLLDLFPDEWIQL